MSRVSIPAVLLIIGLTLAPWFGGHIVLDAQAADPSSFWYSLLVSRSDASGGQLIIAAFILCAFALAGLQRYVLQVPAGKLFTLLFIFWAWLALSIIDSRFKHQSALEFARWTSYVAALMASVAVLGRSTLARSALLAILFGASIVAIFGISEFMQASRNAPNWRIFAGWQNPNAAAGMFAIIIPFSLALVVTAEDRLEKLLYGLGVACCITALWLTASKGGLLAMTAGLLSLLMFAGAQRFLNRVRFVSGLSAVLAAALLIGVVTFAANKSSAQGAIQGSRLLAAGSEREQSIGFRTRLWKDTFEMAKANAATGTGVGTYQQEIKRYTETPGSAVAHNSYLQIAGESGFVACIAFIAFIALWFLIVLRKHAGLPAETNLLRLGICGSVAAAAVDLLVESNLSYLGFSVILFAILGIGLLLSTDGVMPERAPFFSRFLGAFVISLGALIYLALGTFSDHEVSSGLFALQSGNAQEAINDFKSAMAFTPADPQPYAQLARVYTATGQPQLAISSAKKAIFFGPTSARYLVLADAYESAKDIAKAREAYQAAIAGEPNNPYFMRRFFEFEQRIGDTAGARKTAEQLVASEKSDYFKFTALPWLVSTDTVDARIYLAEQTDRRKKLDLLQGAFDILLNYRKKTYTELLRLTSLSMVEEEKAKNREATDAQIAEKLGLSEEELHEFISKARAARIGGESIEQADKKYETLKEIGQKLIALYRAGGEESKAAEVERALAEVAD